MRCRFDLCSMNFHYYLKINLSVIFYVLLSLNLSNYHECNLLITCVQLHEVSLARLSLLKTLVFISIGMFNWILI